MVCSAHTSMEFLPGCSAASIWSPSLCSLLILSSLTSRFRLMKFCSGGAGGSREAQHPAWHPCAPSWASVPIPPQAPVPTSYWRRRLG